MRACLHRNRSAEGTPPFLSVPCFQQVWLCDPEPANSPRDLEQVPESDFIRDQPKPNYTELQPVPFAMADSVDS